MKVTKPRNGDAWYVGWQEGPWKVFGTQVALVLKIQSAEKIEKKNEEMIT